MDVFHEVCVFLTCRFGALWPAAFFWDKNPSWTDFQLAQLDAVYGAYEWEVLAARARSDLGALRERARAALTERSSALPTGFKI